MKRATLTVDSRLLGTWKSDRARTFRHFRPRAGCSEANLQKLKNLFGRLKITWKRRQYHVEMHGEASDGNYEVVARDADSVVIRSDNALTGAEELMHIHFWENHYWIAVSGSLIEWFRRVE